MVKSNFLIRLFYLEFQVLLKLLNCLRFFIPKEKSTQFFFRITNYIKPFLPENQLLLDDLWSILFYSQFIKKKSLCFDIGANIGRKTRQFLLCGGKVVAVEPQEKCVEILRSIYGNNKKVKIVHKALGSEIGEGNIHICNTDSELSTFSVRFIKEVCGDFKEYSWDTQEKVKITTLDVLIQKYGLPDFCKIDVEGYESQVIKGLSKRIPIICFEMHMKVFDDMVKSIKRIESLGSVKFNFAHTSRDQLLLHKWVSSTKLYESIKTLGYSNLVANIFVKNI